MKTTEDVRKYAIEQRLAESEALEEASANLKEAVEIVLQANRDLAEAFDDGFSSKGVGFEAGKTSSDLRRTLRDL